MWSLTRMPAGRPAGMRAIVAARSRTSASMAQPCSYVNRIGASSRAGSRQAVVAPLVRRAALEEEQRPEIAGPGQRDQQVAHGADVLHLHGQAIRRDLPYPRAV